MICIKAKPVLDPVVSDSVCCLSVIQGGATRKGTGKYLEYIPWGTRIFPHYSTVFLQVLVAVVATWGL